MISVDAWMPTGGSFNDISDDSDYGGRFLAGVPLGSSASPQFEEESNTAGYLRGMLVTTREFPITLQKASGFSSQTFHTNVGAWFSEYESARGTGYLRVLWEDGATLLRIPCRVQSKTAVAANRYQIVLKAEQPYFEATSETSDNSSPVANAGSVRCGCEVEFTGAALLNCAHDTVSGDYVNRLLLMDLNTTVASTTRLLVNGVPTPWTAAAAQHVWAVVNGSNPAIEYISGVTGNDPLEDTITANQLSLAVSSADYNYVDMRISTLLGDSRLGGLWRPLVYLPENWPTPTSGWGYYAEDTTDGFRLHLNDAGTGGGSGTYGYNAVYLDSGGPAISAVTAWDVTLANFTGSEARAVLLGRRTGSDLWEELFSSSTNGATTVNPTEGSNLTELMWTIIPSVDTLTTDPSLEINPDSTSDITMGAMPSLTASSTRYKKLHGTFSNSTTGQSITFTNFVVRDGASTDVDFQFPARRADWDVELQQAGLVYGFFELSDPERGIELAPGNNTISDSSGGTWNIKHRSGYG